jgi:putative transposase
MNVSERLACRVTGQHRSTRHRAVSQTEADPDAALREWLRRWARDHPRWGFRRAYHCARGEGWTVKHKRVQRLWREEGLRVPQRRRRKRLGTFATTDTPVADAANRVWAVDFQFDAITDGRPIKIVSVIPPNLLRMNLSYSRLRPPWAPRLYQARRAASWASCTREVRPSFV